MKFLSHLLLAILFSTSLFGQDNVKIKFGIFLQTIFPSKNPWSFAMIRTQRSGVIVVLSTGNCSTV